MFKNTAYLYALTFSSQIISVITIPYQTRILSPSLYGVIGLFVGIMIVANLCINYGFLYSATEQVALHVDDELIISKIYTSTLYAKLLISCLIVLFSLVVALFLEIVRDYLVMYFLYLFAYIIAGLLPDFLYRGLELMKTITIRTVAIRLFSAVMIFFFLKSEQDVLVLPGSLLFGNIAAYLACLYYDRVTLGIRFSRVGMGDVITSLRDGLPFFVSRIAATVYQTGNAIVLGVLYPGKPQVGFYNASDKILSVVKQVSAPVADSIYPYMIKKKDYVLAIKVMILTMPFILIGCVVLFVYAEPICAFAFGEEYARAGDVLRCLIPAMAVLFPTYIICFPILVPMGLSKYANASNVVGMVSQVILLLACFCLGVLDVYALCICASISEILVFMFRLGTMVRFRRRIKDFVVTSHSDEGKLQSEE